MRIAIVTTQCPFVVGGAELHADGLLRALRAGGHEAEIVDMPFKWYPATMILDHMLAARALDISEFNGVSIDLAICLKFPAYLMRHPRKVFWILHQHRQAYDMWDSGLSDLLHDDDGRIVKEAITEADTMELGRAQAVFANSQNVAKRLMQYNGITAEPLYHPPPLAERLHGGPYGDFYYFPSRLSASKRQAFVLEALAQTKERARVIFSGAPDNPAYGDELRCMAQNLGIADRIEWRGFVDTEEMLDLYARARGIIFPPTDEDLGYVALEAMLAGKPLLTLSDAGEPAALIRDGMEGFIAAPEPAALARAMDRLFKAPELAAQMGAAGQARYRALDVSWEKVIAKLLGVASAKERAPVPAGGSGVPRNTDLPTPVASPAPSSVADVPTAATPTPPSFVFPIDAPTCVELLALYDLGERSGEAGRNVAFVDYLDAHWRRYLSTLDLISRSAIKPRRILEIGTSEPYVFTALLGQLFPDACFTAITRERTTDSVCLRSRVPGRADLEISLLTLNVETMPIPALDGWFDLVVVMEVLEHLAVDPLFMFDEIARVTRSSGHCMVTTPNLISIYGLSQAMAGASPYSFGVFVPPQGPYGRHNREYTPAEVAHLAGSAGFETTILETWDVYPHHPATPTLTAALAAAGDDLRLRGQNIHYLGRKTKGPSPYPAELYAADPRLLSGLVEQLPTDASDPSLLRLRLSNKGSATWPHLGSERVRVCVDHLDQQGRRKEDVLCVALPHEVEPGASTEIALRIGSKVDIPLGWFEIGLYLDRLGPFRHAGRCNTISILASFLEVQDAAENTAASQLAFAAPS